MATARFSGGVADGRNLVIGALDPTSDDEIEVRLTEHGEVWHIGAPYQQDDEGVQISHYRLDKASGEYVVV